MSLSNPPQVALWLTVPNHCRMVGGFEVGDNSPHIEFFFGTERDGSHVLFERRALERFVELAQRALAVPLSSDKQAPPPVTLIADHGRDIREEPRYLLG
jgi:hypothetical protein